MTDQYTVRPTGQRRPERPNIKIDLSIGSDPSPDHVVAFFQEHYILEGRITTHFWANKAQLPHARRAAERELRHFLYKDFLTGLCAMERAIEEMDQDELRRICASLRNTVKGEQL